METPKQINNKTQKRTSQDYRESLFKMKPNIYIGGQQVGRDDKRLEGALNIISITFDKIDDPEFKNLLTAESHLEGIGTINRFTHKYKSPCEFLS